MKVRNIEDAVLHVNDKLYCALCGTEISSVENGCSCNAWANMVTNLGYIDAANAQIAKYQRIADEQKAHYEEIIETVSARLPETRFEVEKVDAIVAVPPAPEPPTDGGGEGDEEPTEGGGE
jgi:hypothetical protein